MAETPVSPIKESATTREEMDFDDHDHEHEQETGRVSPRGTESKNNASAIKQSPSPKPRVSFQEGHDEIPPQKPRRPISPQVQAENTLIEAFPSIDVKVVKAVLAASGGQVEPAFNALLSMSDPDFQPEEQAPPQPPRPQRQPPNQLEADERYARQLAEQYNSYGGPRGQARYNQRDWAGNRGPNQQRPHYSDEDREHSFFDDDLPEIGRNIQQGFVETQKKVNTWINNFRKRLDGEDEDEDLYASGGPTNLPPRGSSRQNFGPSQGEQLYGIRKSAEQARRSTDAQRYDADPHEFNESEFERLELRDDEGTVPPPQPPRTSSRKSANPDLFKSQPPKPPQSGPVDEVDAAERKASAAGDGNGKGKKWQPLTSVQPQPDEDNDPFSVGDDDEDKSEDVRKEDTERLKSQASGSFSGGVNGDGKKGLEESGRSGSINAEAAELLAGGGAKKE